jgi:hypothetical protein
MSEIVPRDDSQTPESIEPVQKLSLQTLWLIPLTAALTPILIFLIPATNILGGYGPDSFFDTDIFVTFWKPASITWILGNVVLAEEILMSRRQDKTFLPLIRFACWFYLLIGPLFPIIRGLPEVTLFMFYMLSSIALIIPLSFLLLFLLFIGFLSVRVNLMGISFLAAALSLFIILIEAGIFIGRLC